MREKDIISIGVVPPRWAALSRIKVIVRRSWKMGSWAAETPGKSLTVIGMVRCGMYEGVRKRSIRVAEGSMGVTAGTGVKRGVVRVVVA